MMERKLISEADSRPLVVLDPRAPASRDALDAAVRAAASLTVHFARRSGCGLVLPGDRRAVTIDPDLLAWPQAHVRLALIEDVAGPALSAAQNRRGLVVYVAARVIDRPPRGLGRTPGGCLLVVPGGIAGRNAGARGRRLPGLRRRAHRSGAVMAAVGGRGLSTLAARPPVPALRTAAAGGPALPLGRVRGLFLCILALFAGLQWMGLLEPAAPVAGVGGGRDRRALVPALLRRRAPARLVEPGRRGRRGAGRASAPRCSPAGSATSTCGPTAGAT